MSEISGIFNIARSALSANKKALDVTAQNIANVSTPGYTRQETLFEASRSSDGRFGNFGTGVEITQVQRRVDQFIENEITEGESSYEQIKTKQGLLGRIEATFTDAEGTGINQAFIDFFNALQDLTTHPSSRSERVVLLEQGKALTQRISAMDAQFQQIQKNTNTEIVAVISNVNRLSQEIAHLNGQISEAELIGHPANDLRDQRRVRLNDLAKNIDVQAIESKEGMLTVFTGAGKTLVMGTQSMSLQGTQDPDNKAFLKIGHDPGTGSVSDITSTIKNGKLRGLLDVRDTLLPGHIDTLDRLSASLANEVNRQNRLGFGLDGSTGIDFFTTLAPTASASSKNTGTGLVTVSVSDASSLTLDNYDLTISGGNYTLRNKASGATATGATSATPFSFEGLQITISGSVADGDAFKLSSHEGMAGEIGVTLTDPDQIAASSSAVALPGNNGNAFLLSGIQELGIPSLGGATLQSYYAGFAGNVGGQSQAAQRSLSVEAGVKAQVTQMRDEISGVSLDEEMSNIIKFQRAYEAAARLIAVADEMLQTILAMKR